jgi:hypothetical protein
MTPRSLAKLLLVAATSLLVVFAAMSIKAPGTSANDNDLNAKIQIGFAIAPVPLNLAGRNKALVGYGSYIVNAVADCNGCHTAGVPPNINYAAGGNPYFNQHQVVDPTVYLSGGMDFGPVGTPTGPNAYAGPDIISRNLTPNGNGVPEGGMSFSEFKQIMRQGTDFDHIHPTCTPDQITEINNGATPVCIPTSPGNTVDGNLLQVMPWPGFSYMTDYDIEALYEYLSAIPCINNTTSPPPAGAPNELLNDCGTGDAPDKSVRDSSVHQGSPSRLRR